MKRKTTRPSPDAAGDDQRGDSGPASRPIASAGKPRGAGASIGEEATTTRRRFIKLAATGSVGLLVGARSRRSHAAPAPTRRRVPKPPAPDATRKEIESQKDYLARALKTIREFPLPPGSEMAFAFKPLKAGAASRDKRAGGKS